MHCNVTFNCKKGVEPHVFCFSVESVASGFPVRCGLISSTGYNDLISGNVVTYKSLTPNCWAFPSYQVLSVGIENLHVYLQCTTLDATWLKCPFGILSLTPSTGLLDHRGKIKKWTLLNALQLDARFQITVNIVLNLDVKLLTNTVVWKNTLCFTIKGLASRTNWKSAWFSEYLKIM